MTEEFGKLEHILIREQNKHDNRIVIGGLDKFVSNWSTRVKSQADAEHIRLIDTIAQTLAGYGNASAETRQEMILRALELLRGQTPVTNIDPVIAPVVIDEDLPEAPPDDFDEEPPKMQSRPATGLGLDASVTRLQNVGPAHGKKLNRLGVETIGDLIYHFPHRYDDFSKLKTISQLMYGEEVSLLVTVCEARTRAIRNKMNITTVLLADMTGTIQATYFNQPWLQQQFKAGRRIIVSGRIEQDLGHLAFKQPEWEPFSKELVHTGRIVPVYPLTEGLSNRWLRRLISDVVEYWADQVPEPLPDAIRAREKLPGLAAALREIHFPSSFEKMESVRHRLALDEFLLIQLGVLRQRRLWREKPGRALRVDSAQTAQFLGTLPFQLTGAQQRVLNEILGDIQKTQPMSRLLQGDVGSGKTIVAAAAMLTAVANGAQAALLAPTEILAEQHYKTLSKLFAKQTKPPRVELLTGSLKNREKEEIRTQIASGEIDIAIGTHALIQETVEFNSLALAVIDEQHRFGVEQRAAIRSKGFHPHILVMSATPIPRTLALTVFGDLDLSIIDEMPPGRQEIRTKWLEPRSRERGYAFVRNHVADGEQAFVICPLIEESESIDAKAAVEEYERLRKDVYPDLRVGLIHGKLKPSEKDDVMRRFRDREIDILVATSVVEVGIDVPNATVMLIEGADRFGLAQLHQFRGRVGRGEKQSFCMLLAEKKESLSDERLKVIESTQDGFKLAEEDLKLRGPGEFFGTRQSGLPDLKIAKLGDVKILEEARRIAQDIFESDPDLKQVEHQVLARRLAEFWKSKGDLS